LSDTQKWPVFSEQAGPQILWPESKPNEQSLC